MDFRGLPDFSRMFNVMLTLAGVGVMAIVIGIVLAVVWLCCHIRFV